MLLRRKFARSAPRNAGSSRNRAGGSLGRLWAANAAHGKRGWPRVPLMKNRPARDGTLAGKGGRLPRPTAPQEKPARPGNGAVGQMNGTVGRSVGTGGRGKWPIDHNQWPMGMARGPTARPRHPPGHRPVPMDISHQPLRNRRRRPPSANGQFSILNFQFAIPRPPPPRPAARW